MQIARLRPLLRMVQRGLVLDREAAENGRLNSILGAFKLPCNPTIHVTWIWAGGKGGGIQRASGRKPRKPRKPQVATMPRPCRRSGFWRMGFGRRLRFPAASSLSFFFWADRLVTLRVLSPLAQKKWLGLVGWESVVSFLLLVFFFCVFFAGLSWLTGNKWYERWV